MKWIKPLLILILLINNLIAYSKDLKVGVAKFATPFSAVDSGNHYFGFSIDLMSELCKRINETCEYVAITPENLLDALDQGTVDISLSSRPIPKTPLNHYIFSAPYIPSTGQFATINPNIKSLKDLYNKKIGYIRIGSEITSYS